MEENQDSVAAGEPDGGGLEEEALDARKIQNNNPESEEEDDTLMLHSLGDALRGVTVLPKPHVSKEVMVAALQGQNRILQCLLKDVSESKAQMRILTNKTLEMEAMVGARQENISSQEAIIRSQQEKLEELQITVENFRSKADMFDEAQAQMKNMENGFAALQEVVKEQEGGGEEQRLFKEEAIKRLQVMEHDIKEMPNTIDISMTQIRMMEGDGSKETFVQIFNAMRAMLETHDYDLASLRKDMNTEIDQQSSVLQATKERVEGLEAIHGEVQEMKRNLNICLEASEDVKLSLSTKINGPEVDDKIEERYEDIVNNLMKALQNVQDDEDDFKQATRDLHAALDNLKSDKADKEEVDFIKERIQKMSQDNPKMDSELLDCLKKRVTKEEVEELIEVKVDRDELTRAIEDLNQTLTRYVKRLRKMGPGGGSDGRLLNGIARTLSLGGSGGSSRRLIMSSNQQGGGGGGNGSYRNLLTAAGGDRGGGGGGNNSYRNLLTAGGGGEGGGGNNSYRNLMTAGGDRGQGDGGGFLGLEGEGQQRGGNMSARMNSGRRLGSAAAAGGNSSTDYGGQGGGGGNRRSLKARATAEGGEDGGMSPSYANNNDEAAIHYDDGDVEGEDVGEEGYVEGGGEGSREEGGADAVVRVRRRQQQQQQRQQGGRGEEGCDHHQQLYEEEYGGAECYLQEQHYQQQQQGWVRPQPSGLVFVKSIFPKGKAKTSGVSTKICLACHSEVPNPPREKHYAGASYGGGFQILLPAGGVKGPPMRTVSHDVASSPSRKEKRQSSSSADRRGADFLTVSNSASASSPSRKPASAPDVVSL